MEGDVTLKQPFLAIMAIEQIDNYSFQIRWNDGSLKSYRLSNLQRLCPCANCVDESTGQRIASPASVDELVTAVKIKSVGRYGLKIEFASGCSTGIYPFTMLYVL